MSEKMCECLFCTYYLLISYMIIEDKGIIKAQV